MHGHVRSQHQVLYVVRIRWRFGAALQIDAGPTSQVRLYFAVAQRTQRRIAARPLHLHQAAAPSGVKYRSVDRARDNPIQAAHRQQERPYAFT